MLRDYMLVSPSLGAIIDDRTLVYEGLDRPIELLRVLDGPSSKGRSSERESQLKETEIKIMNRYLQDIYQLLQKKLSEYYLNPENKPDDIIYLQALIQEMIKVKGWQARGYTV